MPDDPRGPDIVLAPRFFVRHYLTRPVTSRNEVPLSQSEHRGMPHDPDTDEPVICQLYLALDQARVLLPDDGRVFQLVLRPTGESVAFARTPWVRQKGRRTSYGPNPTGEIES